MLSRQIAELRRELRESRRATPTSTPNRWRPARRSDPRRPPRQAKRPRIASSTSSPPSAASRRHAPSAPRHCRPRSRGRGLARAARRLEPRPFPLHSRPGRSGSGGSEPPPSLPAPGPEDAQPVRGRRPGDPARIFNWIVVGEEHRPQGYSMEFADRQHLALAAGGRDPGHGDRFLPEVFHRQRPDRPDRPRRAGRACRGRAARRRSAIARGQVPRPRPGAHRRAGSPRSISASSPR